MSEREERFGKKTEGFTGRDKERKYIVGSAKETRGSQNQYSSKKKKNHGEKLSATKDRESHEENGIADCGNNEPQEPKGKKKCEGHGQMPEKGAERDDVRSSTTERGSKGPGIKGESREGETSIFAKNLSLRREGRTETIPKADPYVGWDGKGEPQSWQESFAKNRVRGNGRRRTKSQKRTRL